MKILNGPPNKKKYRKWAQGTITIPSLGGYAIITGLSFIPKTVELWYYIDNENPRSAVANYFNPYNAIRNNFTVSDHGVQVDSITGRDIKLQSFGGYLAYNINWKASE